MKHQIFSRRDSTKVIFECDLTENITNGPAMCYSLEEAVAMGVDLRDADLRGADLTSAYLIGADLMGADFTGAVLTGVNLRGVDFTDVDLTGVNFTGADLTGAVFTGAVLTGADFTGADFTGADLRGVDLRGADNQLLPRATPDQAIENLDKIRAIILDNEKRLNMDYWHGDDIWRNRTCAEETLCDTTHCVAGWLQVCTTEQALKTVPPHLAGVLAAPIASKMFFRGDREVLEWLRARKYVAETAECEARAAGRKSKREAAIVRP